MKKLSFPSLLAFICTGFMTFFCFVNNQWMPTRAWLVNHHFVSFSNKGIAIALFDDIMIYLKVTLILLYLLFGYFSYKAIKSFLTGAADESFGVKSIFFGWLATILLILITMTTPVPWFGFAFGTLFLIFLSWAFCRFIPVFWVYLEFDIISKKY